jgi:predicted phosphodiesterase
MKFALASDIHLEFGNIELQNTENADVLILSGDICVARDLNDRDVANVLGEQHISNRVHDFFENCCLQFANVIYIMGNHEHYHGDIATTYQRLKDKLSYLKNLHILENEHLKLHDHVFFGGTLWTDMNKENPNTLYTVKRYMNDYGYIKNSSEVVSYRTHDADGVHFKTREGKFTPDKSVEIHKNFLATLRKTLDENPNDNFIVVGHHAPSKESTKPRYRDDYDINGAYSSDLSEFILDNPRIKIWTHGHTHDEYDYNVGSTRILCNPRGYDGYEERSYHFKLKFFDI